MPRIAWSFLLLLVLALPLASCFDDESTCATCPPDNSGRIDFITQTIRLPGGSQTDTLRLDSVKVSVDGGAQVRGLPGQHLTFGRLSRGTHTVKVVHWFTHHAVIEPRTLILEVELAQGETRVISFHKGFPRVVDASPLGRRPAALAAVLPHDGWASA